LSELIQQYKTIKSKGLSFSKEKSSKFIGIAEHCSSLASFNEILQRLKKEHSQASHFCYAYRIGTYKIQTRANDDREPNNSAGIPILGQIHSFELTNTLVVVIRYYGGVKLGVGGLVQAYKLAAKEAILNAEVIDVEIGDFYELTFAYIKLVELMNFIKRLKISFENNQIDNVCSVMVFLPQVKSSSILQELKNIEGIQIRKIEN
jgi:uncharacterized YigZ family protein